MASTKLEQNGNQNPVRLNGSGTLHEVSSLSTLLSEIYEQEGGWKKNRCGHRERNSFPSVTGCGGFSEKRRTLRNCRRRNKHVITDKVTLMYRVLILLAHRKHQHEITPIRQSRFYEHTTTKVTTSIYCNYNSWHSLQPLRDCILLLNITIT